MPETFALATSFGVALGGYLTIAILRALIAPVYLSWINRGLSPRTRATVNSIGTQFDAMGQIVGGPILGVVAKLYSVRAALLGSAVTQASAALLFLRAARARQVDAPPAEIPGVEE
jgi:DHA3 family tetracycline resistance protein-like MFS transporter